MSNEPSHRSDAALGPTDATLRAELAHAQTNLARLETEYAELLADPGVILEDRDSTRRLLEAARVTAAATARGGAVRGRHVRAMRSLRWCDRAGTSRGDP